MRLALFLSPSFSFSIRDRRVPAGVQVLVAIAALAGCGSLGSASSPERIVETATGRTLSCHELAQAVLASRFVLLGEQHDEPTHHQRRGALIDSLRGSAAAIVAEHLPRGDVVPLEGPLLPALQAGGFRAAAWAWPVHRPLFEGIAASGLPLRGGDLPDGVMRSLMKDDSALPAALRERIDAAPLAAGASAALDTELIEAHGGTLPPARLAMMRRAQRARDASLLAALQDSGGRPAVLVAGNGHVRADHGVPQLLRGASGPLLNVALVTPGQAAPGGAAVYTHVWTVDPAVPVRRCER